MATTSAYAVAAGGGDAAAPCRGTLLGARLPPHRLAFLSRAPARGASISLPPPRRAATAEGRRGMGVEEEEGPAWVELEPIGGEEQLDRALAEAQQRGVPIVLLWTASWCRKCIYLKPKLEKLAAEYYPRIRFYCVDVNAVPQKLVDFAGVTKMPSIQMWSNSRKQAEVIGGHESWMVIEDVRRMVEQENE